MPAPPKPEPAALETRLNRERRAQLRGLLYLAAAVLILLLARAAKPLALFHAGWWRL